MSKRTGLGRGLGAFFGDDYKAPVKKTNTSDSQQEKREHEDNEQISAEQKNDINRGTEKVGISGDGENENPAKGNSASGNPVNGNSSNGNLVSSNLVSSNLVREDLTNGYAAVKEETESPSSVRKHNLEELDMVLPTAPKKKSAGKTNSGKTAAVKTVEKVKIVEVEKEKFLKISLIEPNREQPRKDFDEEQLHELADSIKAYGVLQPLLVQKKGDYYEIIAGERRWRAAKLAGLREVPVVVREYSKQQSMEIALIENVQRADLNPIEEAKAYQILVQEFGLKQEEVAARVSKNRATITNSMRLLKLDERVQEMLIQNQISGGHARTLLGLEDKEQQYQIAIKIIQNQLSVRELEKLVKTLTSESKQKKEIKEEEKNLSIFYQDLEEKLKTVMGTKVIINKKDKNKGRIEIEYYSSAELERIADLLQSIQL